LSVEGDPANESGSGAAPRVVALAEEGGTLATGAFRGGKGAPRGSARG